MITKGFNCSHLYIQLLSTAVVYMCTPQLTERYINKLRCLEAKHPFSELDLSLYMYMCNLMICNTIANNYNHDIIHSASIYN